jgi:hypothetical protein
MMSITGLFGSEPSTAETPVTDWKCRCSRLYRLDRTAYTSKILVGSCTTCWASWVFSGGLQRQVGLAVTLFQPFAYQSQVWLAIGVAHSGRDIARERHDCQSDKAS